MESSHLKIEKRNKPYFDKYVYKATANILGAAYAYYSYDLETYVNRLQKLKEGSLRWDYDGRQNNWAEINLDIISQFITWRNTVDKQKCLYRIQGNKVSFFSNSLGLLETLQCLDENLLLYKAECLDRDKMYFKKQPKYKYRTYFRAKRLGSDFSDSVRDLSETYVNTLHFCPALFKALFLKNQYNSYRYIHGSYYVDYNDEQMLTILGMWFPDMLGKTFSLVKES